MAHLQRKIVHSNGEEYVEIAASSNIIGTYKTTLDALFALQCFVCT